jgi:hypothetical protein
MCSVASTKLNKNNVIRFLVGFLPQCGNFEVVLCGSAINLDVNQVRDVDFMIYVSGNRNEFLKTFSGNLEEGNIKYVHHRIDELDMDSIKIENGSILMSIHIILYNQLVLYLQESDNVKIYTEYNFFSFDLKYPVVYRKWVIDVEHVYGDLNMLEKARNILKEHLIPYKDITNALKGKIKNAISYYLEKRPKDNNQSVTSHLLLMQILNLVIVYCYCVNSKFMPTIKYVETELSDFNQSRDLCSLCVKLIKEINVTTVQNIDKDLLLIIKNLEK